MDKTLQWRHNGHDSDSNHQPHDCSLNRLFRRRSNKTSKLRVTGLCAGNSPGTGEFPPQMASNAENVSIWWRHHDIKNGENWSRSSHHRSHYIMTSWHDSVFHIDGPLCGESSGDSWILFTNGQQYGPSVISLLTRTSFFANSRVPGGQRVARTYLTADIVDTSGSFSDMD